MKFQRYIITGILTLIPLFVTIFLFKVIFQFLTDVGSPAVQAIAEWVSEYSPTAKEILLHSYMNNFVAVIVCLLSLYLLGFLASLVIGKKMVSAFESLIEKIPVVKKVYGSIKQLINALQQDHGNVDRVVLIDFPSPEMKTLGFVTKTMKDKNTGEELAAVYVPTTPNPTSGYLEIVPVSKLTATDFTADEAMSFIISGGAVSPDEINY